MISSETAVIRCWNLLKYAYGATLIVIGLDKALRLNMLANWEGYVSNLALSVLPVEAVAIVITLGIAEILVGVLMLTKWTKLAAIVAIAALAAVIVNLLAMGLVDVAARDVLIALGALVLVWLSNAIPGKEKLV